MLDFLCFAWDVFLRAWQLTTKPREKPFLRSCQHILKLRERPSYPRLLQQMKPGSIILNLRHSQSMEGHHSQSPWKKNCHWARAWLVFLDCEGVILVDAMLRGETVNCWCLHQDADRRQGAFHMGLALKEFSSNLAWAWQCKDEHKFEDWGTIMVFGWTVLPHPLYSPHLAPPRFAPIWSPERCNPWYEVWDRWLYDLCSENLVPWAGEATKQTVHTHTLVPCWHMATEVDGCGKVGCGVESSLFILWNFCDLGINIYWGKK